MSLFWLHSLSLDKAFLIDTVCWVKSFSNHYDNSNTNDGLLAVLLRCDKAVALLTSSFHTRNNVLELWYHTTASSSITFC